VAASTQHQLLRALLFLSREMLAICAAAAVQSRSLAAGLLSEVKHQIVDMAIHASGIRDTARVLHVSPTTVIKELKKRNRSSHR
jgi:hypothetical protein